MSNVIYNDADDLIGYYKDLVDEIKDGLTSSIEANDWENAKDLCDLLTELDEWSDNLNLLVLSSNNGMGYTVKEYKGE